MKLGRRQTAMLVEAADEVSVSCPWTWIAGDRRVVASLEARGLVAATQHAFGIMPRGCLALRRIDRGLAKRAIAGLRREPIIGGVMPWHVGIAYQ